MIRPGAIEWAVRTDGATLAVNGWHRCDQGIFLLRERLGALFHRDTAANLYLSEPESTSFGPHWDGHDVLVVQLGGSKRWTFFGEPVPHATRQLSQGKCPDQVISDFTLVPGDLVFVPRGWWHDVETLDGPSVHVSLAIYPVTFLDVLVSQLRDAARAHDVLRADVGANAPLAERVRLAMDSFIATLETEFETRR
ncbi:cupin domain-containing protein [Plantactinospora mayteni]|uniref:cupin domain-containing protein n=1 Tax=Plantactinospora mayteni TaxID=566021 RepID=UPI001EF42682|nr:cupin domain-containing protein [Plantactinospora mayteni]